jgi:hypothetical protein
MISYVTEYDYFGPWVDHQDATETVKYSANIFLARVNALLDIAYMDGVDFKLNHATKSYVSGQTLGGFRPQDAKQGASKSSHKEGRGIDIYDPNEDLDHWCATHAQDLRDIGLYAEVSTATPGWCHLTDRMPASGKTFFQP